MNATNTYIATINSRFLILLAAHLPAMCGVAWYFNSGLLLAAVLSALFLAGPAVLFFSDRGSKLCSVALGIASMCFSALLIYLSGGMIEMHFHIFTMLALMIAFQFPWPLVAAAATIAVHHLAFYFWLPGGAFKSDVTLGVVLLHAFWVVFEVVPAVWLTYQFGSLISARGESTAELSEASERMIHAAREVTEASRSVASSGAHQRELVETTVQFSAEIDALMKKTSNQAVRAADLTLAVKQSMQEGNRTLADLTESMRNISVSSREIQNVVKTIDEIAFQTNILALNAAVEAARAGEAGLGFAVVATEVGNLAQRSRVAARETAELIEESVARSREGGTTLARTSAAFASITTHAQQLGTFMDDLKTGSTEGARGVENLAKTIRTLEADVHKIVSEANVSAEAGNRLSSDAQSLENVIHRLENA